MAPSPMTERDRTGFRTAIQPARELVAEALSHADVRQDPMPTVPAADSRAIAEIGDEPRWACAEWGDDPVRHAHGTASLLLVAVEDHLEAINRLYEPAETITTYAPQVLLRALLEAAGRVHWLVDSTIGTKRRVARGKTETLYNVFYMRQTLTGDDRVDYDRHVDRPALYSAAERFGFEVERHNKDRPGRIGEDRRPTSTKAIDRILGAIEGEAVPGTLFRHTSAVTHSTLHGLLASLELDPDRPTPLGGMWGQLKTSSNDVNRLLGAGLYGYVAAAGERRELYGWQAADWTRLRRRVLEFLANLP